MRLISITLLLLLSLAAGAVPARRDARLVQQADGTILSVYAHGDEHFDWLTDADGHWIQLNRHGNYEAVPTLSEVAIRQRRTTGPYYEPAPRHTPIKTNVAPRGLVILAQFQDVKFQTDKAVIDSMLNGEHFTRDYTYTYDNEEIHITSAGSARKFFEASSNGQYSPRFDVIGPVTVSHNMAYYGSNSPSKDYNSKLLIKEACQWAAASGIDLSEYNHDGDKYVDFVYVIYAGYGEADGGGENTIWPHAFRMNEYYGYEIGNHGVLFNRFACGSEMNHYSNHHMGIGTFCHEFGHILGLPDIYSTDDYSTHKTSGYWDIMDYGCYLNEGDNPPTYSGYERFFFGWTTPRVLNQAENVVLHPLLTSNQVLLITATGKSNLIGNDPDPNLFYVLENRQQTGFDQWLPGHGMLITKINYLYTVWNGNTVNYSASDMHIDILEADGLAPEYESGSTLWSGRRNDAFPFGAKDFYDIDHYPITDIRETNGIISFRLKGGIVTEDPQVQTDGNTPSKIMENGKLYILRNGQRYTSLGQAL